MYADRFVEEYISIHPIDSVRSGWHEGLCTFDGCEWRTTGTENVVEEAAYDHIKECHPETPEYVGRHRKAD